MHREPRGQAVLRLLLIPGAGSGQRDSGAIQGAGDVAMMLNATPQATALIKYLAGPEGGTIWVTSVASRRLTTR